MASGFRTWWCVFAALAVAPLQAQDDYEALLREGQRKMLRGELTSAAADFDELVAAAEEGPAAERPARALVLDAMAGLGELRLRRGECEQFLDAFAELAEDARQHRGLRLCASAAELATGKYQEAATRLRAMVEQAPGDLELRFRLSEVLEADGQRKAARELREAIAAEPQPKDGWQLLWYGRAHWRLGGRTGLEAASQALVESLRLLPDRPEARTTFGLLKLEAYGEARGMPSGERDLVKVLDQHGDVEEALLAVYRLRSSNFQLDPAKTEQYLDRVLAQNPRSVAGWLERCKTVLDDRRFGDAKVLLDRTLAIDDNHRLTLAHRAACAFLLHETADYERYRARALAGDPGWPEMDRVLGDHLNALYRFGDAIPFFEAALAARPDHVPSMHGLAKALIYCGQGPRARDLLLKAKELEPGLVSPWRNNAIAVQQLLDDEYVITDSGPFGFQIHRNDEEVLREYLIPVHLSALDVLGAKYNYRPQQNVKIEVLHTWDDFSVRTIGFRGFTALGACFGPLVTLVSPVDSDVRKLDFMWEATVWHEYTHVLTLGLSKHRVPRWLTEGFSVYEEKSRDKTWERGMERELFDAFHNDDIPPVRLMNRLFRGPRILFGYYQGGLLVELIARDFGFDKAVALLIAYGDDLDLEAALASALGIDSQELDRRLLKFIAADKLKGMKLVPRHDDNTMARLRTRVGTAPDDTGARLQLCHAYLQRDMVVDAGRHLAEVLRRTPEDGNALLVRAELVRRRGDLAEAVALYRQGFAAGADDFDARIACGRTLLRLDDTDGAEEQFQRAKRCWPLCTEQANAPELLLARLYNQAGDRQRAMLELTSYCLRSGRAYAPRLQLAEHELSSGQHEPALRWLEQCNRIDPFSRSLHRRMAECFVALGRTGEAARELAMAAAVLPEFDRARLGNEPAPEAAADLAERSELWLEAARLFDKAGDRERARTYAERCAQQGSGEPSEEARRLVEQWRGR